MNKVWNPKRWENDNSDLSSLVISSLMWHSSWAKAINKIKSPPLNLENFSRCIFIDACFTYNIWNMSACVSGAYFINDV